MITRTIESDDALKMCSRPEDHFFDRKGIAVQPAKLLRHIAAFANADGGELVVGIDDEKIGGTGTDCWNGTANIEGFNGFIQALREIDPPCNVAATFLVCVGLPGYVLHLEVEKDAFVHKTPDGKVYQRVSAQSLPLSTQQALDLTYAKGEHSYEDAKIPTARIEDIVDSKELRAFLTDYSPQTDPLDFTVNQYLVDVRTWEPTVAGLLLFANNPSTAVPKQCAVRIARYETREEDPERDHLKETFTVEGPLYHQVHLTVKKLKEIMSSTPIWTMEGLRTVEYPPESVWEIITNAVIHRDYSISDHIHVQVFDNRIEVKSPGRLPGYVTVENILDARYSRNPKIVRTLSRYKNPPNRDMGEGLNTAFQKMAEQIVTLLRQIEVGIANGKPTPQACNEAAITVQTYYRWRKEYGGLKLEQAKRMKELEKENTRLKRLVAELSLEKQVLKDVASGNF